MASSGKKKTTMAKVARERRLRERRLNKQAKKEARKQASAEQPDAPEVATDATGAEGARLDLQQSTADSRPPAEEPTGERMIDTPPSEASEEAAGAPADREREPLAAGPGAANAAADQRGPSAKDTALRRLREAPDEQLAVFEGALRGDALAAGASENELRDAQSGHPEHG